MPQTATTRLYELERLFLTETDNYILATDIQVSAAGVTVNVSGYARAEMNRVKSTPNVEPQKIFYLEGVDADKLNELHRSVSEVIKLLAEQLVLPEVTKIVTPPPPVPPVASAPVTAPMTAPAVVPPAVPHGAGVSAQTK